MLNQYATEIKIAISVIILAIILALSFGVYHYHSKFQEEVTSNAVLSASNAGFVLQLKADSDAADKLAKDSLARENAAKLALDAAQKKFLDFSKQSQYILVQKPSNPNNLCESANLLYDTFIKGK